MNRRYLSLIACLILATLGYSQAPPTRAPVPEPLAAGFGSITAEFCREVLTYLAGPECEGRLTGTDGYQKAADYVAGHFKDLGLKPVGDDGTFFQNMPFNVARINAKTSLLSFGGVELACGQEVMFEPANEVVEAPVVFLSGGREARLPDPKVMLGRLVILQGGMAEPNSMAFRLTWRYRPAAILRLGEDVNMPSWRPAMSSRRRGPVRGTISSAGALRLADALGIGKRALIVPEGEEDVNVIQGPPEQKVHLVVEAEAQQRKVPNVVGFIEGSDPDLKHEMVICGSHLDHLGVGSDGRINYGADDDGSGSTGLVAVARAFAKNEKKPRRSLLFLAFCGEELGLLGSRYYVNNPIFPLENAVAELQMDMIGRNEEHEPRENRTNETAEENVNTTHLVGSKRLSTELHEIILDVNSHVGFDFEYDQEGVYTRSDHYNFARKGIPIAFFFSGFHRDYHQPTDTVDKINFDKIARTAQLVYLTAFTIADNPVRLKKDK